jgi:hypothetical protein
VRYELEEVGAPTIADVLEPVLAQARKMHHDVVQVG